MIYPITGTEMAAAETALDEAITNCASLSMCVHAVLGAVAGIRKEVEESGNMLGSPRPQKHQEVSDITAAREYLAQAQSLAEVGEMGGHAFFVLGCAVKRVIDELERQRK